MGVALVAVLAQACGGGDSEGEDASPTATSTPAAAASGTPAQGFSFSDGEGPGGQLFFGIGASEELAEFLGISQEQLESELSAEGATSASVAEAHDKTRDELKAFYTERQRAQVDEAVAAGRMTQEDADQALDAFASRLDDMIDGVMPLGGGPGFSVVGPDGGGLIIGGPSEELAEFLGISLDQLESELSAEDATPASVAEAHGRTRDELKTFYTEQIEAQIIEEVVAGRLSPEEGDAMIERLTSNIDAMIDGQGPSAQFRSAPGGGPSFESEGAPPPSGQ
jgi:hypothetical protein